MLELFGIGYDVDGVDVAVGYIKSGRAVGRFEIKNFCRALHAFGISALLSKRTGTQARLNFGRVWGRRYASNAEAVLR